MAKSNLIGKKLLQIPTMRKNKKKKKTKMKIELLQLYWMFLFDFQPDLDRKLLKNKMIVMAFILLKFIYQEINKSGVHKRHEQPSFLLIPKKWDEYKDEWWVGSHVKPMMMKRIVEPQSSSLHSFLFFLLLLSFFFYST